MGTRVRLHAHSTYRKHQKRAVASLEATLTSPNTREWGTKRTQWGVDPEHGDRAHRPTPGCREVDRNFFLRHLGGHCCVLSCVGHLGAEICLPCTVPALLPHAESSGGALMRVL